MHLNDWGLSPMPLDDTTTFLKAGNQSSDRNPLVVSLHLKGACPGRKRPPWAPSTRRSDTAQGDDVERINESDEVDNVR